MFAPVSLVSPVFSSLSSGNNFKLRGEFKEKKNTAFFRRTLFSTFVWVAGEGGAGPCLPLLSSASPWSAWILPPFSLLALALQVSETQSLSSAQTGLQPTQSPPWPLEYRVWNMSHYTWPWLWHWGGGCRVSWCTECPFFSQRMLSVLYLPSILAEFVSCSVREVGCTHQDLEFLSSRFLQWFLSQIFFMWAFIWCLFFYLVNTHTKHKLNQ